MTIARRDFAGGAAATTLAADINATSTTITIASGTGWPTGANGEFYICIDRGHAGEEKCLVASRSGTTLTLASAAKRGKDGTTAASHTAGVAVEHVLTAADLDEANAFVATPGVVGEVVASAPGDTAAAGAVGKWADVAHRHARESYGSSGDITASAPGDTVLAGSTGKVADAGHRHAREAASVSASVPRGVLYRSSNITTTQSGISAAADVTGMTAIAVTGDAARRVRVTVHLAKVVPSSGTAFAYLYEGATEIACLGGNDAGQSVIHGSYDFVPTAASHTYKIRVFMTGAISMSATNLSYVIAEDIGI